MRKQTCCHEKHTLAIQFIVSLRRPLTALYPVLNMKNQSSCWPVSSVEQHTLILYFRTLCYLCRCEFRLYRPELHGINLKCMKIDFRTLTAALVCVGFLKLAAVPVLVTPSIRRFVRSS